jgi:hypothetical protein
MSKKKKKHVIFLTQTLFCPYKLNQNIHSSVFAHKKIIIIIIIKFKTA